MSEIQRRGGQQFQRLLRRFGVTRTIQGSQITDDVQAVAAVPRTDVQCSGNATLAALAANRSQIQLFNPAGSGVTVIVHRIWTSMATAGLVRLGNHDTALADTDSATAVMERTRGNQPEPAAQLRTHRAAAVGSVVQVFELDIADRTYQWELSRFGGVYDFEGPSLAEGRGFILSPSVDNLAFISGWLWTERITER